MKLYYINMYNYFFHLLKKCLLLIKEIYITINMERYEDDYQPTIIGRLLKWCIYTCIGLILFVDCVQRFF